MRGSTLSLGSLCAVLVATFFSLLVQPQARAIPQQPPACEIIAAETRPGPSGTTIFDFYVTASGTDLEEFAVDGQKAIAGPIQYRARVSGGTLGAWTPTDVSHSEAYTRISITVKCTSFQFQVRAKNQAGEFSAVQNKVFNSPFPVTKLPTRPLFLTSGKFTNAGASITNVATADLDQDGTVDVVDADYATGKVYLRRNAGGNGLSFTTTEVELPPNEIADLAVGFLRTPSPNAASPVYPDVVVSRGGKLRGIGITSIASTGQLNYSFFFPSAEPFFDDYYINQVALGDVNGDGKLDLVAGADAYAGGYKILILPGNGDRSFGTPEVLDMPVQVRQVTVGDVNGDGKADIAATCEEIVQRGVNPPTYASVPEVLVFLTSSEGGFSFPTTYAGSYDDDEFESVIFADINGDQKLDLVAASKGTYGSGSKLYLSQAVEYFLNKGDGTFTSSHYIDLGGLPIDSPEQLGPVHYIVAAEDVNFDGTLDLVFGSNQSATGKTIHFEGLVSSAGVAVATRVKAVNSFSSAGRIANLAVGDLDGNGQPDIVTANLSPTAPLATLINLTPGGLVDPAKLKLTVAGVKKLTDGVPAGYDFNFSVVLGSTVSNLHLRLQAQVGTGEWIDVPGAQFVRDGVNGWKLVTANVPQGSVSFRVVASASGFPDRISDVFGPVTVNAPSYGVSITTAPIKKITDGVASFGKFAAASSLKVPKGEVGLFAIQITNNGSLGDFTLDAPVVGENLNFLTLYASDATYAQQITAQVVPGTYILAGLRKGETRTIYAKIRPGSLAEDNSSYTLTLKAASVQNETKTATATLATTATKILEGTYFVRSAAATGDDCLAEVLKTARNGKKTPRVKFEVLPTSGVVEIVVEDNPLGLALAITKDGTWLDGNSQREYAEFFGLSFTTPAVRVKGHAAEHFVAQQPATILDNGLYVQASNTLVEGVEFAEFYQGLIIMPALQGTKTPTGNVVRGCKFVGNFDSGILILNSASNTVGGLEAGQRNIFQSKDVGPDSIAISGENGLTIGGGKSVKNKVLGNIVGPNDAGTGVCSYGVSGFYRGIYLYGGASSTLIKGNVVSNNYGASGLGHGILLEGATVSDPNTTTPGNIIVGNRIGTDGSGSFQVSTDAFYSNCVGVKIGTGVIATQVGGVKPDEPNVMSGNGTGLEDAGLDTRVVGNFIGTDLTGTTGIPNEQGVNLFSSTNATIGGVAAGERNIISANRQVGISIFTFGPQARTSGAKVLGNYIGVSAIGGVLRNGYELGTVGRGGVFIFNSPKSLIASNVIAYNAEGNVIVEGTEAVKNTIRLNSIYGSDSLGINLIKQGEEAGSVTDNDFGDADTGPNNLQNLPIILGASFNATGAPTTNVGYALSSTASTPTAKKKFTIDFYLNDEADGSQYGEGKQHLGSILVETDSSGLANGSFKAKGDLRGKYVTATATSMNGNNLEDTSEFGNAFLVPTAP